MNEDVKTKAVNVEDLQASARKVLNKGVGSKGTCTTASATQDKAVTFGTTFRLVDGATAMVRFTYGIGVAGANLVVTYTDASGTSQTTAAKPIYYRGAALPAGIVKAKDTLLLKYNGTQWDIIGVLDAEAGTRALLDTGTDQTERTWQAKVLKEYISDNTMHPLEIDSLSWDYEFKVGDVVSVNGVLYRCTESTEDLPFTPVCITEDGVKKLVYEEINGKRAYVFDSYTLNAGWEKVLDVSPDFRIEEALEDNARQGEGYAICATAGATAAKEAYIRNFQLKRNCRVSILFSYGFTASNPTLNISGTGAKPISFYNDAVLLGKVRNNTILTMVYDGTSYNVTGIEYMTFNPTPGAVDLGLPSGILWAEKNIGADNPEDAGLYFSWGNVIGHAEGSGYDFSDATYANTPGAALTGNISVGNTYDAARANMGAPWRMPTVGEFQELNSNCDSEWTDEDGVAGRRFTSRINGNSIFFPASGSYNGTSLNGRGSYGHYWSSSYDSATYAYSLYFHPTYVSPANRNYRRYGFTARAVQ